jgi:hypothetical protein
VPRGPRSARRASANGACSRSYGLAAADVSPRLCAPGTCRRRALGVAHPGGPRTPAARTYPRAKTPEKPLGRCRGPGRGGEPGRAAERAPRARIGSSVGTPRPTSPRRPFRTASHVPSAPRAPAGAPPGRTRPRLGGPEEDRRNPTARRVVIRVEWTVPRAPAGGPPPRDPFPLEPNRAAPARRHPPTRAKQDS